ncbi:hypothetical protein R3P38DRAFT_1860207 [Favolaschia claudopus]|uniref:Uncharacterized protein n=1 Tax=Favolaschia claudopus TaxID=2862362 RepID=A0AAW0DBP8_9AGAR
MIQETEDWFPRQYTNSLTQRAFTNTYAVCDPTASDCQFSANLCAPICCNFVDPLYSVYLFAVSRCEWHRSHALASIANCYPVLPKVERCLDASCPYYAVTFHFPSIKPELAGPAYLSQLWSVVGAHTSHSSTTISSPHSPPRATRPQRCSTTVSSRHGRYLNTRWLMKKLGWNERLCTGNVDDSYQMRLQPFLVDRQCARPSLSTFNQCAGAKLSSRKKELSTDYWL